MMKISLGQLSFIPYQNFTHTGLVSPSGGGHFNEAWWRNVKWEGREEIRVGRSERNAKYFPLRVPELGGSTRIPESEELDLKAREEYKSSSSFIRRGGRVIGAVGARLITTKRSKDFSPGQPCRPSPSSPRLLPRGPEGGSWLVPGSPHPAMRRGGGHPEGSRIQEGTGVPDAALTRGPPPSS